MSPHYSQVSIEIQVPLSPFFVTQGEQYSLLLLGVGRSSGSPSGLHWYLPDWEGLEYLLTPSSDLHWHRVSGRKRVMIAGWKSYSPVSALTRLHWGNEEWSEFSLLPSGCRILGHVVFTDTTLEERGLLLPSSWAPNLAFAGIGKVEPLFILPAFFSKSLMFISYILAWVFTILNRKNRGKYGYFPGAKALLLDAALVSSQGLQLSRTSYNCKLKPISKGLYLPLSILYNSWIFQTLS